MKTNLSREEFAARLARSNHVRRSWLERSRPTSVHLHCVCRGERTLTNDGPMLRMFGTVQCSRCGRAVFDADGQPIKEVSTHE